MIKTFPLTDNLADKIVDIVLKKNGDNPLSCAQIQIILPTKRACLTVKNAFLKRSQKKPILIPKLLPLYDLDNLSEEIPQALPKLKRTLLLQKLCAEKPNISTPEQALKVAISLGQVLDEFYQFEAPTENLAELVQNPVFAEHWNETVVFLDIITKEWPKILAEKGLIDEADRRIRLIDSYVHNLSKTQDFIIAAGLDGGLPVVRRLLKEIDNRQNGLILTEGIDTDLTDLEFDSLPENHYQFGHKQILRELNKKPRQVEAPASTSREVLIRQALKPEDKTEQWQYSLIPENALDNVIRIDCPTDIDEAVTIALILRGTLEKPEQTASLVTTDRTLARRVITEMKRWGITLDDSAGTPISQTEVGIFLNLIARIGSSHKNQTDLLALLKHPLAADGKNPMGFRKQVKIFEKEARENQSPFNPSLNTNLDAFVSLFDINALTPFKTILLEHIHLAETLATSHDRTGSERLWSSDAGKVIFEFLTHLIEEADLIGEIEPIFYPNLMEILFSGLSVRLTYGMHPRLDILGPIEARFYHTDVCIIGGLNEGVFPPMPETGPWLNRSMRKTLSLPAPEQKIAELAADFAHCFCAPKVYLTRAQKTDGAETIPSRFLARLEAVLMGSGISFPMNRSNWAEALDQPNKPETITRPQPTPPVSARPNRLSVTRVETWMRDPYSIYARYILKLFPLRELAFNQRQQQYGVAVHDSLETFIKENPNNCDKGRLMTLANQFLSEAGMCDADKAFYLPRFEQAADFIIAQQSMVAGKIEESHTEVEGEFTFDVDGHPFTLTGKADRIDLFKNRTVRILDYKTGTVPNLKEIAAGYAPQLTLEALILMHNGFKEVKNLPLSDLAYWKLASKTEDCKVISVTEKESAKNLVQNSFEGLKKLIRVFNNPQTPYEACPVAGKEPTYNDYEHLSRIAEWGKGGDS